MPPAMQLSASATAMPPSEQSCALLTSPARIAVAHGRLHVALELEVERGRTAGDHAVLDLEVLAAAELLERLAEKHDHVALVLERRRSRAS